MKLNIRKLPTATAPAVEIELATDTGKKPIKMTLTREQWTALSALLETAFKVDVFSFALEL